MLLLLFLSESEREREEGRSTKDDNDDGGFMEKSTKREEEYLWRIHFFKTIRQTKSLLRYKLLYMGCDDDDDDDHDDDDNFK